MPGRNFPGNQCAPLRFAQPRTPPESAASVCAALTTPAWRATCIEDVSTGLKQAVTIDVPRLIVLPSDYSIDVRISEELGEGLVAT